MVVEYGVCVVKMRVRDGIEGSVRKQLMALGTGLRRSVALCA